MMGVISHESKALFSELLDVVIATDSGGISFEPFVLVFLKLRSFEDLGFLDFFFSFSLSAPLPKAIKSGMFIRLVLILLFKIQLSRLDLNA